MEGKRACGTSCSCAGATTAGSNEEGHRVCSDRDGNVVFFTPSGKALFDVSSSPLLGADPVERLVRGNRARGIAPDGRSGAPRWNRDRDIPWTIEAAAWEAIDPVDTNHPVDPVPNDDRVA